MRRINEWSVARYGRTVVELDPTAALWLAEAMASVEGDGWQTWRAIARIRERVGRGTDFPGVGSPCL